MGRKNSAGLKALSHADKVVLAEMLDDCFDMRRGIDSKPGTMAWSNLTAWVDGVAIPHFRKTRQTTSQENAQIHNWYKNQCTKHGISIRRKPVQERINTGSESSRAPCIRDLVINQHKDELTLTAKEPNPNVPDTYIAKWNQAVTDRVETLSAAERSALKAQLKEDAMRRAEPPTRAEILASQGELCDKASEAVRRLLGWERREYGDAIVFITMAYRHCSNQIKEHKFFVSNDNDYIAHCSPFNERYDAHLSGYLATLADIALPLHEVSDATSDGSGTPSTSTAETGVATNKAITSTSLGQEANPRALSPALISLPELAPNPVPLPEPAPIPVPLPEPAPIPVPSPEPLSELLPLPEPTFIPGRIPTPEHVPTPVPSPEPTPPSVLDPGHAFKHAQSSAPISLPEPIPALVRAPSFAPAPLPEPIPALGDAVHTPALDSTSTRLDDSDSGSSRALPANQNVSSTEAPVPSPDDLPVPVGTRKPRPRQGKSNTQPIRASARSKRPPKQTGPVTDKNQAPRTKVPVSKRWAYVSEEDSPRPHKKSRRLP